VGNLGGCGGGNTELAADVRRGRKRASEIGSGEPCWLSGWGGGNSIAGVGSGDSRNSAVGGGGATRHLR
jgi:hypothetical protein